MCPAFYQDRNAMHILKNQGIMKISGTAGATWVMSCLDMPQSVLSREVLVHRIHHPVPKCPQ